MDSITLRMSEVCDRWDGRFAEAMKNLVGHCAAFDDSFGEIRRDLSGKKMQWRQEAVGSRREREEMEKKLAEDRDELARKRKAFSNRQEEMKKDREKANAVIFARMRARRENR